jgi:hypothetical protein
MIPALANRGFGHGSGIISPDHRIFIVNIPKNASSYLFDWGNHYGWRAALAQDFNGVQEVFIFLRDPMDRWVSGMAQYVKTYILSVYGPNGPVFPGEIITEKDYAMDAQSFITQYNDVVERLIIDNASRFDDHVWPQCEIIDGVLPGVNRRYFRVGQDIENNLARSLGWKPVKNLDRNSGDSDPDTQILQEFFRQRLTTRPEIATRIRKHYAQDFELIAQVLP